MSGVDLTIEIVGAVPGVLALVGSAVAYGVLIQKVSDLEKDQADLKTLPAQMAAVNAQMGAVNQRLDSQDRKLDAMDYKLDRLVNHMLVERSTGTRGAGK